MSANEVDLLVAHLRRGGRKAIKACESIPEHVVERQDQSRFAELGGMALLVARTRNCTSTSKISPLCDAILRLSENRCDYLLMIAEVRQKEKESDFPLAIPLIPFYHIIHRECSRAFVEAGGVKRLSKLFAVFPTNLSVKVALVRILVSVSTQEETAGSQLSFFVQPGIIQRLVKAMNDDPMEPELVKYFCMLLTNLATDQICRQAIGQAGMQTCTISFLRDGMSP